MTSDELEALDEQLLSQGLKNISKEDYDILCEVRASLIWNGFDFSTDEKVITVTTYTA